MQGVDAIAEVLRREGVEYLSVYPAQPLIDACAKVGVRPVICRQERVGMSIADGFSRTTNGNRIGVFASQVGPGTENAFPGAAQAFSDNVPILHLAGGDGNDRTHVEPVFNPVENYRHVTRWAARVDSTARIPELMRRAFYQLRTGKTGPVMLEISRDIWFSELEEELDYLPARPSKTAPDPTDVAAAADALLAARRPVIHAGQGCLYAEAWDELKEVAELLRAPVMTTMQGKSVFPENHPLALGSGSIAKTKQSAHFIVNADVIFGVGCSFTKTNYGIAIPTDKIIVHNTSNAGDINKDLRVDFPLLGDARLTLRELISEIKSRTGGAGRKTDIDVESEVANVKQAWLDEWMPQLTSDEVPINQYRIIWDLLHHVDRANTIITHDSGSPREQLVPFWECVAPRTYMGWGKSTQLGHGLGLIMGAKLAEPDKLCINIMGDAAIGMVGMDIETAVRNKIGILTIVFDNSVMAIERNAQPYTADTMDSLALGGDYKTIAEALGAWGKVVEQPDDFIPALKEAIAVTKTGQPALLDCIVKEGYGFSRY
ncbi:MAG: thiamine pyrophosphate-requiring protein [Chloroflexi bacterium]|nr:thiamine pyrophosphate-requiring protein [Chloroflexota bacterium]